MVNGEKMFINVIFPAQSYFTLKRILCLYFVMIKVKWKKSHLNREKLVKILFLFYRKMNSIIQFKYNIREMFFFKI